MKPKDLKSEDVTPENLYLNRRKFIETSIYAATGLATAGAYRYFRNSRSAIQEEGLDETKKLGADFVTPYKHVTGYNNFYEFSTSKEAVAAAASSWKIQEWTLEVDGLVETPQKLHLADLLRFQTEERIYHFRCVEGWSMIIPWQGFPLRALLEKSKPLTQAKYVAFETYFNEADMPAAQRAGLPFPYVEGLRLDEALHPLTLIATGLYGKRLPNQNGAPLRLVVPWKYGFKSIKSVVKIKLTEHEPSTTWNLANPQEYGFYSNVNPTVDHPRWSQTQERRIGELGLRETLMFNGYADQVAGLYTGMDLRKNF